MSKKKNTNPEVTDLKAQLARALADYDNLVKRTQSERVNIETAAQSKAVLRFLPIFDMLISAQAHLKDQGLELVVQEFKNALSDLGVEEIEINIGDEFNPEFAEVIEMVDGGEHNTVAEVLQSGWKLKNEDLIIRPAKVRVYGGEKII